jgi:hypothetical protein
VDDAAREIAATPFWQRLTSLLEQLLPHCAVSKLQHMVMYGLGSLEQPGAVHIRYQLAAAQLLAAMLPLAAAAEAYDPVFTALDRAALLHCGIEVRTLQWRQLLPVGIASDAMLSRRRSTALLACLCYRCPHSCLGISRHGSPCRPAWSR